MIAEPADKTGSRVWRVLPFLLFAALLACGEASAQPHRSTPAGEDTGPPAEPDVWLRRLVGTYRVEGMIEIAYPGYRCVPDPDEPGAEEPAPDPVPYCKPIKGKADCIGIGKGPGVQCMLNAIWDDLYELVTPDPEDVGMPSGVFSLPGGVANLGPAMTLFGLDPGKAGINYLLVDNKGLPEGATGLITGNTATFKTTCVNATELFDRMKPPPAPAEPPLYRTTPRTCERTLRIDAKPDAGILHMSTVIEINDEVWTRLTLSLYREAANAGG